MTIVELWHMIDRSQLLVGSDLERLRRLAEAQVGDDLGATLGWLVDRSVLTAYQADVLRLGGQGPFHFGDYRIVRRVAAQGYEGQFQAVHLPSGHPVLLDFVDRESFESVDELVARVEAIERHQQLVDPWFTDCYELVELPEYKFHVTEDTSWQSLSRLPQNCLGSPTFALRCLYQMALGLRRLHDSGLALGSIRPQMVRCLRPRPLAGADGASFPWVACRLVRQPLRCGSLLPLRESNRAIALAQLPFTPPELFEPDSPPTAAGDIYSLGCILFWLVTGRPPFLDKTVGGLRTRHETETPPVLSRDVTGDPAAVLAAKCLKRMLMKRPEARWESVDPLIELIASDSRIMESDWEAAAQQMAAERLATSEGYGRIVGLPIAHPLPQLLLPIATRGRSGVPLAVDTVPVVKSDEPDKLTRILARRSRRPMIAVTLCLAVVLGWAGPVIFRSLRAPLPTPQADNSVGIGPSRVASNMTTHSDAGDDPAAKQERDVTPSTLSPTVEGGPAFDFRDSPASTQILLHAHLSRLLNDEEGKRGLRALGPEFAELKKQWQATFGINWTDIDWLVVAVSPDSRGHPTVIQQIGLRTPEAIPDVFGRPSLADDGASSREDQVSFRSDEIFEFAGTHAFLASERAVPTIVVGGEPVLREILDQKGRPPIIRRELERLRKQSHAEAEFSLLWVPSYARYGAKDLLPTAYARLIDSVDAFVGDGVRGVLFSADVSQSDFTAEMRWETNSEVRLDIRQQLPDRIAAAVNAVKELVARMPRIDAYWADLANRLGAMAEFVASQTQLSMDRNQLVLRVELPRHAAHNLVLATELSLAATRSRPTAEATGRSTPSSLAELLERRISFAVPQDSLETAVGDLVADVNQSFPEMNIRLAIEIVGKDLQVEGITRNQQIRDFRCDDLPLSEVLTQLVMKANPVTTVKIPNEIDQRLVWLLSPGSDNPNNPPILITTRKAAQEKGWVLPRIFQLE